MNMILKNLSLFILIFACFVIFKSASFAQTSLTVEEVQKQQAELQNELKDIESKIAQYQSDLKTIGKQKKTLNNKISQLKTQEKAIALQIKATELEVADLKLQIANVQFNIEQNDARLEKLRGQLERLLLLIYKIDNLTVLYPFFGAQNFSDVFKEIENLSKITEGLNELLDQIRRINAEQEVNKSNLAEKKDSTKNLLVIKDLQKNNLTISVNEQSVILKQTKGKESNYQNMLADQKKLAKTIRERLYQLLDVEKQINFGQAVQIAQWAGGQTGVRASFLLAILTQESNLGRNVGTCNRPKDPPTKSWKVVMHPTRDQPAFIKITDELGMNPDITPISCPMKGSDGKQIGWGGAMGPAQFIPSTWMGYKDKVSAVTGKPANPWDIRDAFMASAIKLANDGATTQKGEWAAAMRYFSGSTNPRFRFYGDSVVAQADKYQEDIDELNK